MSPLVQSALVSGVIGLVLWFFSNRANQRALEAARVIQNRQANTEDKKFDLSVLESSIERLTERLGQVEDDLKHEREQRKLSNAYARTLAAVLRQNQMEVPAPPPELDLP